MSRNSKQAVGNPNRTVFPVLNSLITWGYRDRVEYLNNVNKGIHEGLKQYIYMYTDFHLRTTHARDTQARFRIAAQMPTVT